VGERTFKNFENVTSLDVSWCRNVTFKCIDLLGDCMRELNVCYCSGLTIGELNLSRMPALECLETTLNLEQISGLRIPKTLRKLVLGGGFSIENVGVIAALPEIEHMHVCATRALTSLASLGLTDRLRTFVASTCNDLCDISPLARCANLTSVNLNNCTALQDVSALAACKQLRSVSLAYTGIRDVSFLSECKDVTDIDIGSIDIPRSGLSCIAGCIGLKRLDVSCISTDIEFVGGLEHLERLNLSFNKAITSLSALAGCEKLRVLTAGHARNLCDLTGIPASVEHLSVESTLVSELSALAGLSRLTYLNIGETRVTDRTVESLYQLTQLFHLDISMNQCQYMLPSQARGHWPELRTFVVKTAWHNF
jgi:Leucine-rich repeat (LRR) protein